MTKYVSNAETDSLITRANERVARLQGATAIVTGGARGIGQAVANRFVAEGARVAIVDLGGPDLEAATRLASQQKETILAIEGDVTCAADVRAAVDETLARFGRIDVLVNNAGVAPIQPFLESDMELFDRVFAVNVRGSFMMAQATAAAMAQRRSGCIVQIASTCAFSAGASRNMSIYNMSKAAVRQMVASLAGELAPLGIRVNAVAPGTIDTAMTRSCLPDEQAVAATMRRIPLRRFGQPDDIAAACAFLCSDEARYITGQTLVVDGGRLIA